MAEESEDIVACATDCAFTTLYDVVEHRITLELPFFFFLNNPRFRDFSMYAICLMNKVFFGYDLKNVGPATIDDRTGKNNLQKIQVSFTYIAFRDGQRCAMPLCYRYIQ